MEKYIEVETKKEYRSLLKNTLEETNDYITKFPEIVLYDSISSQISDIINTINESIVLNQEEIYEKYSLGAIAVKNFDANNEIYSRKLQDIFGGLFEYWDMIEE